jgi:uncharacterized damage-inducible protein DinB
MHVNELVQTLFGYHYWANARVLANAAKVSPADYLATTDYSHGSLHNLLFHLLRADNVWRHVCQERKAPAAPLQPDDFPDVEAIRARWQEEERAMRQFLASLSSEEMERTVEVTNWRGGTMSMQMWRMLVQVILHGMQHRSEIAQLLTKYGQSPGDLDFILYKD